LSGETDLDAAIRQVVYVNNVSNHTYTEDNDYFSDDDVVIDSSVNQTILAAGDVHQDFDTVTNIGDGVATGDGISDSAVVTGGVEDSVVSGDDTTLVGSAVGDGNTILNNSDGNALGDSSTAVADSLVAGPIASGGGDAIQAVGDVNTGSGDQIDADHSVVNTGEGDTSGNTGVMLNSNLESGEGDVAAIQGSDAEATSFGAGAAESNDSVVDIDDSAVIGSGIAAGEDNTAEGELSVDASTDVDVDESLLVGSGVAGDDALGLAAVEVDDAPTDDPAEDLLDA
jgi:hypothetical protein